LRPQTGGFEDLTKKDSLFNKRERRERKKDMDPFDAPADDAADDMFDMPVGDDDNVRVLLSLI
jgi:hypothetical protein